MKEDGGKTRKFKKSKASKRRARNKRRKKEKQQGKYHQQQDIPTPTASTSSEPKTEQTSHSQHKAHESSTDAANRMWQRTYENSVRWLCSQQVQFLRQQIDHLQQENDFLRTQLYNRDVGGQEDEYITSPSGSEEEEAFEYGDEPTEVDEGYLKFMEITLRHREELRKTREEEAKQKKQDDGSGS